MVLLVFELGRAAQAGWGPTARWLAFLVVIASALAVLAALSHLRGCPLFARM